MTFVLLIFCHVHTKHKVVPYFTKHQAIITCEGTVQGILTSAPDGGEWLASHPGRFTP
jgi:hypothetical protein